MALPLTPLLLLAAEWKVLGCFTGAEGLLGPESSFFLRKAPEGSQISRCELGIDWSITLVLLHGWENNFLGSAVLKCLAW